MTDWDRITKQIQRAMEAVDDAHEAGQKLRHQTTTANAVELRQKLDRLSRQLGAMKSILDHESGFSMDELADVLSEMFSGKPAPYRTTPRYEVKSNQDDG